ncbi:hypothetical protein GCM10010317_100040 [Streptomyces mirabilis]|nr:hypothetical protein GCM10010317_100040 [Streptomyces mirabilis]
MVYVADGEGTARINFEAHVGVRRVSHPSTRARSLGAAAIAISWMTSTAGWVRSTFLQAPSTGTWSHEPWVGVARGCRQEMHDSAQTWGEATGTHPRQAQRLVGGAL